MKKLKSKKIILAVLTIMLIVSLVSPVLATSGGLQVINENTQSDNNTLSNNTPTNNTNTNTNNTNINTSNNNTSRYNNNTNTLPKTGVNDYSIALIIIVCLVSAVYAYKKIRDYNKF